MIAGKYAVSIQYGGGYHYFVWTGDDKAEWEKMFTQQEHNAKAKTLKIKKGAKPKAIAWQRNDNPGYG